MKRLVTIVLISMFLIITFSGCQEGTSSASDRQVKLLQNENFNLQNIIKAKDTEIAGLQAKIVECEKNILKIKAGAVKSAEAFMEMMQNIQKKNLKEKSPSN